MPKRKSIATLTIAATSLIFTFLFAPCLNVRAAEASIPPTSIEFDHVEDNMVFLKPNGTSSPKSFKTHLYDLTFLGSLRPASGKPYFLFSGKSCKTCEEDRSIYSLRPDLDGTLSEKPEVFVYPGKILDPKTKRLVFSSRAFFGRCLIGKKDVYVAFQNELVDRRRRTRMSQSVLIAEAEKDYFKEELIEHRLPSLTTTLQLVKQKKCHEINGRNRFMLVKPLDPHPHDDNSDEPQNE